METVAEIGGAGPIRADVVPLNPVARRPRAGDEHAVDGVPERILRAPAVLPPTRLLVEAP